MTHQEINEAIAEHLGWKPPSSTEAKAVHANWVTADKWWINPHGNSKLTHDIPNYYEDLNAMHEAEKVLNQSQQLNYQIKLGGYPADNDYWLGYHSTAAHRAEAFLKILNLWK